MAKKFILDSKSELIVINRINKIRKASTKISNKFENVEEHGCKHTDAFVLLSSENFVILWQIKTKALRESLNRDAKTKHDKNIKGFRISAQSVSKRGVDTPVYVYCGRLCVNWSPGRRSA